MHNSALQKAVQHADDQFTGLTGSRRIRVIESGGSKLIHLLGKNDPWSNKRVCKDPTCPPCDTRVWLQDQEKEARRSKVKLPEVLVRKTSTQCRREGANCTLQCLLCVPLGRRSLYKGESSHSARERQYQHTWYINHGVVTNPMVIHSIKEHGGVQPRMTALIDQVESRPLYRTVREAVKISLLPGDSRNFNQCLEWGQPRVPVLTATGGDPESSEVIREGDRNPRREWTKQIMTEITEGRKKRVRYWTDPEGGEDGESQVGETQPRLQQQQVSQQPVRAHRHQVSQMPQEPQEPQDRVR